MKNVLSTTQTERTAESLGPLNIRSILVPIDFSPASQKALEYAMAFARHFDAKLTLLHVVEPVTPPDLDGSFALVNENERLMEEAKLQMDEVVKTSGIPREAVEKLLVRYGRSFHEIANVAQTQESDLIVISTHGYTGLKHVLLGSTTERVVRYARCPVLVVRSRP